MKRKYHKYPRTPHLPWSLSKNKGDRLLSHTDFFKGKEVVVTLKMDGENTSLYCDHVHARSTDSKHHASQSWLKQFHASVKWLIPARCRVCGENMYAKHSIFYDNLDAYFLGFSMWSENNYCLSYAHTLEWFKILGIVHVPLLYKGLYDEKKIKKLFIGKHEGYVIRTAETFHYDDFSWNVAKFVRAGHVQTTEHWKHQRMIVNKLRSES